MANDNVLTALEAIHELQIANQKFIKSITKKLSDNPGESHVSVDSRALETLQLVLEINYKMINDLVEHSLQTDEKIDQIIAEFKTD